MSLLNSQSFIPHKMQADDLRHHPSLTITKVALHRIPDHLPQLLHRLPLSSNGMPERRGAETSIHIFCNLKDNLRSHLITLGLIPS